MHAERDEVARILRQLKQEVRRQKRPETGLPLAKPAVLEQIHATSRVNPHLPIAWPTWPSGVIPKVVAFAQKVTRRLLRWYINPIVEQQNNFNAAVALGFDALQDQIAQLQATWQEEREALRSEWELKLAIAQAQWQAEAARIRSRLGQLGAEEVDPEGRENAD